MQKVLLYTSLDLSRYGMTRKLSLLLLALLSAGCGSAEETSSRQVFVFAAASLQDVLPILAETFQDRTGLETVFNFAGSNVLALQIEAAVSADLFLSADEVWVDYLEKRDLIEDDSRRCFTSNRLVVIANQERDLKMTEAWELAQVNFRFLSLADPEVVPAGRYARQFLQSVRRSSKSLWAHVEKRIVPALDVRAALRLVEADPEILGIVYRSDAATSDKVRIEFELAPQKAHPIRYSGAIIKGSRHPLAAHLFLQTLASRQASMIFRKYGFVPGPCG